MNQASLAFGKRKDSAEEVELPEVEEQIQNRKKKQLKLGGSDATVSKSDILEEPSGLAVAEFQPRLLQ